MPEAKSMSESKSPKSSPPKSKPVSNNERTGTTFPVGRIHRQLKNGLAGKSGSGYAPRVSMSAAVAMSGTLDAVCKDVFNACHDVVLEDKKSIITPKHLRKAFEDMTDDGPEGDKLRTLMKNVDFTAGGHRDHIEPALLGKNKKSKTNKSSTPKKKPVSKKPVEPMAQQEPVTPEDNKQKSSQKKQKKSSKKKKKKQSRKKKRSNKKKRSKKKKKKKKKASETKGDASGSDSSSDSDSDYSSDSDSEYEIYGEM